MTRDMLFEIGLEEVPARFMPGTLKQLRDKAGEILKDYRLNFKEIDSYGTPRRLALYVTELSERQEDFVEEARGPSKEVAFDDKGNPTKAAVGFAKGRGVNVDSLVIKKVKNKEYVFAQVKSKGKGTMEILPEILQKIIRSLSFPKPMRWGSSSMRFIRPIRWLVALYGEEIIPLKVEGVTTGRETYGHRFLSEGKIKINSPKEYFEKLKEGYVIVDQKERKDLIWKQITELAEENGGAVREDEELLEEINYLLEYPAALCGEFEEDYLKLPEEVLITPMKEHQRYFPVWNKKGGLLPKFITVRNGVRDNIEIVTRGNEKVLGARLADVKFFYEEDIKLSLEERVTKLKDIVFQEKLGTMYDKTQRIIQLSEYISNKLQLSPGGKKNALRCAYLSKADLVTSMVYEFTELQGIMGEYYARHDGEDEEVCRGIREHYMPRFAGDDIPATTVGTVVAIADKIDSIVGCFAIGIQPTGSQDPYGLRRQAQGICNIIKEKELDISLQELIAEAYDTYTMHLSLDTPKDNVVREIGAFFKQRLAYLMEEEGIRYDVVNAILGAKWDGGADVFRRAYAVSEFKKSDQFEALLTAFTRAQNLAKKATVDTVNTSLLEEEQEKLLWESLQSVKEEVTPLLENGEYLDALRIISRLRQPIDEFFDNVMVMVKDEKMKNNRLALLKSVTNLMGTIADFSQIVVD